MSGPAYMSASCSQRRVLESAELLLDVWLVAAEGFVTYLARGGGFRRGRFWPRGDGSAWFSRLTSSWAGLVAPGVAWGSCACGAHSGSEHGQSFCRHLSHLVGQLRGWGRHCDSC